MSAQPSRSHSREILALAVPAFATLISEPLLMIADSAVVGHLGTSELAGLAVSTNVLTLLAGLCVFLAYGTTATVARRLGAGDRAKALSGGFDGMALATLIGLILTVALMAFLEPVIGAFGVDPSTADAAHTYLAIAGWALAPMLVMLAATGVLRGLQDTRTPLYVAITANLTNIALNIALVYGLGLGIAGAAIGTLLAQTSATGILCLVVLRGMRHERVQPAFNPAGILAAARDGGWLFVRTITLRASILLTAFVAAQMGAAPLAAHQVTTSLWNLLAFALDALAIAAQAIIGRHLGAADPVRVRELTRLMVRWGIGAGIIFGVVIAAAAPWIGWLFTSDPAVHDHVRNALWVVALTQPLSGVVFVLDGVLIGAGDGRYLAIAGVITLVAFTPLALAVHLLGASLPWLWVAFAAFMLARGVTLSLRARTDRWMRLGLET